ncbi:MAG: MBOAT family O-acyltransferase [Ignavibacteriaceae bacterium]
MFQYLDLDKLSILFKYDEWDPLLFSTAFFLFLFFFLLIAYRFLSNNKTSRVLLLLVFSFFFYYKVSGLFFLLLILTSFINYYAAISIGLAKAPGLKKSLVVLGIIFNVALLGYFKYTNFFLQIINDFSIAQLDPLEILLPIGISFYTFKAISYLVEVYWENIEPEKNFLDFTLYISFFANILAGPIDRANAFLPQVKQAPELRKAEIGTALYLILAGLFKKVVIADYISINFVDRIFDSPLRYTGVENLLGIYGYALQIYCDFSGYTDMAMGIALLLGFKLMENFNSPYKAASVADFWRRWHISLSTWLLDYLFRPLQMKFRNLRTLGNASALLITFILCGFWHGASWTFIFWGALHGFFMAFAILTAKPRKAFFTRLKLEDSKLLKGIRVFITFHLIAAAWVFFRVADFQSGLDVFNQIFTFFQGEVFMQFVEAYPVILGLIILGYILHFLPKSLEIKTAEIIARTPVAAQAFLLAVMMWLAAQSKSADLQPFIYFQF